MKVDESVAKLKKGDLVRSKRWGWIGTIVGFEEGSSMLYHPEKGLLPIVHWSYPEEESWRSDKPYKCHPRLFEVIQCSEN